MYRDHIFSVYILCLFLPSHDVITSFSFSFFESKHCEVDNLFHIFRYIFTYPTRFHFITFQQPAMLVSDQPATRSVGNPAARWIFEHCWMLEGRTYISGVHVLSGPSAEKQYSDHTHWIRLYWFRLTFIERSVGCLGKQSF